LHVGKKPIFAEQALVHIGQWCIIPFGGRGRPPVEILFTIWTVDFFGYFKSLPQFYFDIRNNSILTVTTDRLSIQGNSWISVVDIGRIPSHEPKPFVFK